MTLLQSTAGAIDKRAEYRTTSTPAICKILMIKPAVPKVLCQPHEHVSLSKTSLKKLKSNVQRLKLWLGEIVFLSFTLELWVAPRHSNDIIANITWQVHCNDRPSADKKPNDHPWSWQNVEDHLFEPSLADDLNEQSATRTTWSNIKGTWNKKAKQLAQSIDNTEFKHVISFTTNWQPVLVSTPKTLMPSHFLLHLRVQSAHLLLRTLRLFKGP